MLSFKPNFSFSSFTFIKKLLISSLSAVRVGSFAYLRWLIFLPAILIPACASSSPVFLVMYSAYKLNSRVTIYSRDVLLLLFGTSLLFHVQFWLLPPDLHTDFSRGRSGHLSGIPISLIIFYSLLLFIQSKALALTVWITVNKVERDAFLQFSCLFDDPVDVGNLISGSSAFSKSNLNICKFTVYVMLKPGLENFEHYFTSMWDECNCVVIWAFFGIAFLWDWNENWQLDHSGMT